MARWFILGCGLVVVALPFPARRGKENRDGEARPSLHVTFQPTTLHIVGVTPLQARRPQAPAALLAPAAASLASPAAYSTTTAVTAPPPAPPRLFVTQQPPPPPPPLPQQPPPPARGGWLGASQALPGGTYPTPDVPPPPVIPSRYLALFGAARPAPFPTPATTPPPPAQLPPQPLRTLQPNSLAQAPPARALSPPADAGAVAAAETLQYSSSASGSPAAVTAAAAAAAAPVVVPTGSSVQGMQQHPARVTGANSNGAGKAGGIESTASCHRPSPPLSQARPLSPLPSTLTGEWLSAGQEIATMPVAGELTAANRQQVSGFVSAEDSPPTDRTSECVIRASTVASSSGANVVTALAPPQPSVAPPQAAATLPGGAGVTSRHPPPSLASDLAAAAALAASVLAAGGGAGGSTGSDDTGTAGCGDGRGGDSTTANKATSTEAPPAHALLDRTTAQPPPVIRAPAFTTDRLGADGAGLTSETGTARSGDMAEAAAAASAAVAELRWASQSAEDPEAASRRIVDAAAERIVQTQDVGNALDEEEGNGGNRFGASGGSARGRRRTPSEWLPMLLGGLEIGEGRRGEAGALGWRGRGGWTCDQAEIWNSTTGRCHATSSSNRKPGVRRRNPGELEG